MASVTVTIPNTNWVDINALIAWNASPGSYISLGNTLSVDGTTELFLGSSRFPRQQTRFKSRLSENQQDDEGDAGPDFNTSMENGGSITCDHATITDFEFDVSDADSTDPSDPYLWRLTNPADLNAFADALSAEFDRTLTVTFNDNAEPSSPHLPPLPLP